MRRILVDTSVFIDFFRGRKIPLFEAALRENAVLLSPFVRLELLQGAPKSERDRLAELLGGIPQVPFREDLISRAELMLQHAAGRGLTVGIVDLLIASQAEAFGCRVMSFDAVFKKLEKLKLVRNT